VTGGVLVHGGQRRHALAGDVRAAHEVARALRRDHRDVDVLVGLDLREVDREAVREHQHRARLKVSLDRLAEQLALARVWRQDHDDRGFRYRLGHRYRPQAVGLHALDRLASGVQTDAHVLAAVVQVQRVRATLAAVADHRHRLAQPLRQVDFVVDLHSVLLITTGPERTTSTMPCRGSSSTKSPTSSASPENSTVVPSGPVDRTFAPRCSSASSSEAATLATISSRLCTSSPVRSSTSTTSTSRSSCLRTWPASARPWSICSVIRERPGCRLGPTEIPRTWKPRRRITPETLVSVFCPSSTSSERTRTLFTSPPCGEVGPDREAVPVGWGLTTEDERLISSIFRGLPEFV